MPLRAFVEKEMTEELKESFGFTEQEIRNNLPLLMRARREKIRLDENLKVATLGAINPKGYLISQLKRLTDNKIV